MDDARLVALERRTAELAQKLDAGAAAVERRLGDLTQRVEVERADMQSTLEELHADLSGDAVRAGAAVDRVVSEIATLREVQAALGRRLDEAAERLGQDPGPDRGHLETLEARLRELELVSGAVEAQGASSRAAIEQLHSALSGIEAGFTQRLEAEVQTVVSGLTQQLESQGRSLQAAVAEGLAEVQAAAWATPAVDSSFLRGLEEAVARRDAELEELHDLHAALDAGMGELRSGIVAGRAADDRTRDALDEIYRRLEALSTAQVAARVDQGRGRRSGKKSPDSITDAAAALAAVDELVREQRQLKAQVMSLQRTVDAAATAAARAALQVAPLGSLRSEVRVLHTQLDEQKATLDTLAKSVESQRPKAPSPARASAKKASRTTKDSSTPPDPV